MEIFGGLTGLFGKPNPYTIKRSLRLRSSASAYISRTPLSAGSRTTWTWSGWVKRGAISGSGIYGIFSSLSTTSPDKGYNTTFLQFNNDALDFRSSTNTGTANIQFTTTAVFRDPSAWYHIVLAVDTTQATNTNGVKLYVNGVLQTGTFSAYVQNTQTFINNNQQQEVGRTSSSSGGTPLYYPFDGYLAEVNHVDGQQLTPSSFATTDTQTGAWIPKKYSGTYGTNGFYLPFTTNSLNTDITSTATATAPFGGTANNAKVSDSVYLTTNTTTGSAIDILKYDFGAPTQVTRYFLGAAYFTGGTTCTWALYGSNDDVTYSSALATISVTNVSTNYSGSINAYYRYYKLRAISFGTNGQAVLDALLVYQDGIGLDSSGNGNNWTPTNVSMTSGTTYDSMIDSPTNTGASSNYPVLNSVAGVASGSSYTLTQGNLYAVLTSTSNVIEVPATMALPSTGKYYWEVNVVSVNTTYGYPLGIGLSTQGGIGTASLFGTSYYYYISKDGTKYSNGSQVAYGASYTANDVIGVAFDAGAGTLTFYKNNTTQGTAYTSLTSGPYYPKFASNDGSTFAVNFGQRPFAYTPPSGYVALNTFNLPTPTIGTTSGNQAKNYFDTKTYAGGPLVPTGLGIPTKRNYVSKQVSRSLRFRSSASAYLSRTPAASGSLTTWTMSLWCKRGTPSVGQDLFGALTGAGATTEAYLNSSDQIAFYWNSSNAITTTALFRDPSAWYHLVFVWDTTNATATSRQRIYVNGILQSTTLLGSSPSLNQSSYWNQNILNTIGRYNATGYYDGHLADVYFIDGQALTPSSFGENNTDNIWVPKAFSGTYGTNGFYLPFNLQTNTTYAGGFNGSSQYLNIASNAAFNMGSGDFTVEAWVYFTASGRQTIITQTSSAGSNVDTSFFFERNASNYLNFGINSGATNYAATGTTTIPNNIWVHVAGVRYGNNIYAYLNGVLQATTSVTGVSVNSSTYAVQISGYGGTTTNLVSGNISNVRIVKGTAVYTGAFTPPTQALTAITGTSLLTLQSATVVDNSTNAFTITNTGTVATASATPFGGPNICADSSSNYNNWIPNSISLTAGATYDSMLDSPSDYSNGLNGVGNHATWNPSLKGSNLTLSAGNLNNNGATTAYAGVLGTFAMSSGKWYFEGVINTLTSTYNTGLGLGNINTTLAGRGAASDTNFCYLDATDNAGATNYSIYGNNNTYTAASLGGSAVGDVIMVAYDAGTGKFWLGAKGTWYNSGNPAAGTNPTGTFSTASNPFFAYGLSYASSGISVNFGQRAFTYSVPSGFSALNTYNVATPTTYWWGNGSGTSYPDLIWIKDRSSTGNNIIVDTVNGEGLHRSTNQTVADFGLGGVLGVNKFGLSVGADLNTGATSNTYVAWAWQAGNRTTSTNTDGTITSTVSKNVSAGFSIVNYTGNLTGTPSAGSMPTVGHGLGVAPKLIISKSKNVTGVDTGSWFVWSAYTGSTDNYLRLNTTAAVASVSSGGGGTMVAPTSTVFSTPYISGSNINVNSYVAYCWVEVAGYSKFGSYTGNGSADGTFVYCGFRPRWIMVKYYGGSAVADGQWVIMDTSRDTYNVGSNQLYPSLSAVESAAATVDLLSNGFKFRGTYQSYNNSGSTYIFAAFAETPFKYARAR